MKKKKNEKNSADDLDRIRNRIRQKADDYMHYNFSWGQNALLQSFFDLAQEFDSLQDFYRISVAEISEFIHIASRLYIIRESDQKLVLVCDSSTGLYEDPPVAPLHISMTCHPYEIQGSYIFPIHRKPSKSAKVIGKMYRGNVMGMLEVYPSDKLSDSDVFFLTKYANRIGYNLHNRLISEQNINHLKFINNLVLDIEHNVITPNMYFRHLFNRLKKNIGEMEELEKDMTSMKQAMAGVPDQTCKKVMDRVATLHIGLQGVHKELMEHHATYSLFLESLFRRDHFKMGQFVLRPTKCQVEKDIIAPQIEHYSSRFESRGIVIERPLDMIGEEIALSVDIGLLSQVYSNLFSNAVKYASAVKNYQGQVRKSVTYGREILHDYFGTGKDGIKFNVFSTGPHLSREDAETVFTEGYRGDMSKDMPGTGHGLALVKQVVEIHGGVVGYESTAEGNNFFFILPLSNHQP
jgi:signal transduction histidine kinase